MTLAQRLRVIFERPIQAHRKLTNLLGPDYYVAYSRSVTESSGVPSFDVVRLIKLVLGETVGTRAPLADPELAPRVLHALGFGSRR